MNEKKKRQLGMEHTEGEKKQKKRTETKKKKKKKAFNLKL
jgi:hypothetical protein